MATRPIGRSLHRIRTLLALLLLAAAPAPATTSAQDAPAPIGPAATPTELTLGARDERLSVPVSIGAAGPYPFIIDTGAERSVVSQELAAMLGLAPGRPVRMTAMTGTTTVRTVVVPALLAGGIVTERIEAPALAAANLGAAGMLGIDALQGRILAIDFDAGQMTVRRGTRRDRGQGVPGEIIVRARNLLGQLVVTDAHYRGRRVKVIIDTGSAVSIGNAALRAHSIAARPARRIGLTSVTGAHFTAEYTQLSQFELGGLAFGNLPVAFNDAAPFRRFGLRREPALLLGMDALRLFRHVEIDFANREIRFSGFAARPAGALATGPDRA